MKDRGNLRRRLRLNLGRPMGRPRTVKVIRRDKPVAHLAIRPDDLKTWLSRTVFVMVDGTGGYPDLGSNVGNTDFLGNSVISRVHAPIYEQFVHCVKIEYAQNVRIFWNDLFR